MAAFSAFDVPAMVALLTEDVWLRMPPLEFEHHGHEAAARFFAAVHSPGRRLRFAHTRANGQPAHAVYQLDPLTGVWHARGLFVLTLAGDRIQEVTRFEVGLLPWFGLPRTLPE